VFFFNINWETMMATIAGHSWAFDLWNKC